MHEVPSPVYDLLIVLPSFSFISNKSFILSDQIIFRPKIRFKKQTENIHYSGMKTKQFVAQKLESKNKRNISANNI